MAAFSGEINQIEKCPIKMINKNINNNNNIYKMNKKHKYR